MFAEDRELREPEGRVLSDAHHGSAQFLLPRLQSAQRRARVSHSAAERQTRPVRDPRQPRAEQGVSTAEYYCRAQHVTWCRAGYHRATDSNLDVIFLVEF